jgi:hypothetical protein
MYVLSVTYEETVGVQLLNQKNLRKLSCPV